MSGVESKHFWNVNCMSSVCLMSYRVLNNSGSGCLLKFTPNIWKMRTVPCWLQGIIWSVEDIQSPHCVFTTLQYILVLVCSSAGSSNLLFKFYILLCLVITELILLVEASIENHYIFWHVGHYQVVH